MNSLKERHPIFPSEEGHHFWVFMQFVGVQRLLSHKTSWHGVLVVSENAQVRRKAKLKTEG